MTMPEKIYAFKTPNDRHIWENKSGRGQCYVRADLVPTADIAGDWFTPEMRKAAMADAAKVCELQAKLDALQAVDLGMVLHVLKEVMQHGRIDNSEQRMNSVGYAIAHLEAAGVKS